MSDDSDQTDTMRVARGSQNTHRPSRIPARILWPALGFPAVIAPDSTSPYSDATNSICVLLLSKKSHISKQQAADHLRVVPWNQRHARSDDKGQSFTKDEVEVRSDADRVMNPMAMGLSRAIPPTDKHGVVFDWGYDLESGDTRVWHRRGISGNL